MVGWAVRVFEGDAVERNIVEAVFEPTEISLAVPEAHSIGIYTEGSGGHLQQLAIVGDWRGEVLDERGANLGARGTCFQNAVHWRRLRGEGIGSGDVYTHRLDHVSDR